MSPLKNNKGFTSILVIFTIVALGSLIVIQMASAFQSNQMQNQHNRLKANFHLHMINMAQRVKRGHDLAQLDNSCSSYGSGVTRKNLPGHSSSAPKVICQQTGSAVCITDPNLIGDDTPMCAPLADEMIDWRRVEGSYDQTHFDRLSSTGNQDDDQSETQIETPSDSTSGPATATGVTQTRTQITVPPRSNPIWRDCNGNTCMRLALCPLGETNCADDEVVGIQTIMFQ